MKKFALVLSLLFIMMVPTMAFASEGDGSSGNSTTVKITTNNNQTYSDSSDSQQDGDSKDQNDGKDEDCDKDGNKEDESGKIQGKGHISANVDAKAVALDEEGEYKLDLTVTATNKMDKTATDVQLEIKLDHSIHLLDNLLDGLKLDKDNNLVISLPDLAAGETKTYTWTMNVKASPGIQHKAINAKITANIEDGKEETCMKGDLYLPGLPSKEEPKGKIDAKIKTNAIALDDKGNYKIDITIMATNNMDKLSKGAMLELMLDKALHLKGKEIKLNEKNNPVFILPDLKPGESKDCHFTLMVEALPGEKHKMLSAMIHSTSGVTGDVSNESNGTTLKSELVLPVFTSADKGSNQTGGTAVKGVSTKTPSSGSTSSASNNSSSTMVKNGTLTASAANGSMMMLPKTGSVWNGKAFILIGSMFLFAGLFLFFRKSLGKI
ncbi:hypothetical protein [Falsibacillus pallidus]|uniref:LPXTG-motif cell wall-anchored protein n=1 Tax=Falsibacillus pallidus TaxID=493781 RepID=A0A370GQX2_9BACI|nr:hypothetical protein [Falsibacillus pallidus]RDI45809.1 hypothetical protein DFR59_102444 [Falsibacillus pallidus]